MLLKYYITLRVEVGHPDRYFLVYSVLPYMYWGSNFCSLSILYNFQRWRNFNKGKKDAVCHKGCLLCVWEIFVHVLVQSSGNAYIKSTKKSYWVMKGLYITDISFLHFISLYSRVICVCIDVIHIVDFVESRWEYFLSEQSVDFNSYNQGNCC